MNIAVIGTGGTGGYFDGKLAKLMKSHTNLRVNFVARGEHLRQIQENGLIVDTDEGKFICKPSLATDDIAERDLFGGTILRKAKELGTNTPVTERIYSRINEMKPI